MVFGQYEDSQIFNIDKCAFHRFLSDGDNMINICENQQFLFLFSMELPRSYFLLTFPLNLSF